MIELLNCDCLEYMYKCEDNKFDLAIVDPPYGIQKNNLTGFKKNKENQKIKKWDVRPTPEYFKELFRISKNQIIFGAQYFTNDLPDFSQPIIWDKMTGGNYFADGEFAYCSIKGTLRIFRHQWCGAFKDSERGKKSKHVNQKPIELYRWLLKNYAKKNDKIFDSHLGSGSIAIACYDLNFDLVGCEIDEEYYNDMLKRYNYYIDQLTFF